MKAPGFFEGVLFALAASVGGSALYWMLRTILPLNLLPGLMAGGLALAYLVYLLARAPERYGRLTTFAVWSAITLFLFAWWPPLTIFLAAQLGMLWLVRSLYFQPSLLAGGLDLLLQVIAVAGGLWAFVHTGSVLLALWCFFLIQALFVLIPGLACRDSASAQPHSPTDRFRESHRSAALALQRLTSSI